MLFFSLNVVVADPVIKAGAIKYNKKYICFHAKNKMV